MNSRFHQQGATLFIAVVMLIMLTMFALAAIRLSGVNLRIVGNAQWQREMEVLADSAIEQFLSSAANFGLTTTNDQDICADGRLVSSGVCTLLNPKIGTLNNKHCVGGTPAKGYTIKLGEIPPDDNTWTVTATVTETWSGASVSITRGVAIRQLSGNCPE